jgi:hypothetical protein
VTSAKKLQRNGKKYKFEKYVLREGIFMDNKSMARYPDPELLHVVKYKRSMTKLRQSDHPRNLKFLVIVDRWSMFKEFVGL